MFDTLPQRPHLDWYRKAAKKTLLALRADDPSARLADVQLAIAREHGFVSWRAMHAEIDQASTDRLAALAKLFVAFADVECKGSSPLYEHLSRRMAGDPPLLTLAGLGRTPIPNLWFAAVHLLLRQHADSALARHYPSLTPGAVPAADTFAAFKSFCLDHRSEIVRLMRSRLVQTNEVARSAFLLPAFGFVQGWAGQRPLALVEVGASAGLNLCFDRYFIDYGDGATTGPRDASVRIAVERRGEVPIPLPPRPITVAERIGIDLNPIRPGDAAGIAWLEALIWPEHERRRRTLHLALPVAAATPMRLLRGDAAELLDGILRLIAPESVPCVFQTHSLNQFTPAARQRLLDTLAAQPRPVAFISRHHELTLDLFEAGERRSITLAETDAHGRWLQWKHQEDTLSQAQSTVEPKTTELESPVPTTRTERTVADTFLDLAVPQHRQDHRSGTQKPAAAILKKHPEVADANIYTAVVLGRHATVGKLLKADRSLATTPGGPRNWQPLSYLAFSRFLKHEPKRERDFLKSARLLLNADADTNTYWLENPDDPNSVKESVLYGAAGVANNTALTRLLLDAGANPDDHGDKPVDCEALYHACEFKNNEVLKLLHDAKVSKRWWSYCLLRKLDFDDFAGATFMLERGADPNHLHPGTGRTALHWAIKNGRGLRFVRALVNAGADVNLADKGGLTPYTLARRLGRTDVAEYLLKHGAVDERDEVARFIDAAAAGDAKAARAMLRKSPALIEGLSQQQLRALPDAAAAGNLAGVKAMLDLGFPIDTPGDWAGSALHQAAWHGHPAIVKLLLSRGARIDVHQQWNGDALHTALHAAQHAGHKHAAEIVRAIIRSGRIADVRRYLPENADDPGYDIVFHLLKDFLPKHADDPVVKAMPAHRKGHKFAQWKPIMDAAFNGEAARVRKLLAEGADPNVVSTTPARYRPLHRAIEHKKTTPRTEAHVEAVVALLDGGADPHLRGAWDNATALQMAACHEPRFIPVLIDRFKPLDMFHAAALGDERRVAALLKKDKSLANARDANQWVPLHYCAASVLHRASPAQAAAQAKVAKMLIEAGADPMAAWQYNEEWPLRPLYYAAGRSNNPAVAEVLLDAGADACDNESVYHASDEGHRECLALFERRVEAKKLAAECTMCLRTQLHWGGTRGAPWLLAHGADPNALSPKTGENALHIAVRTGKSQPVIALLLRHGANPSVKDAKGNTALDLARQSGKQRLIDQLAQPTNARPRR